MTFFKELLMFIPFVNLYPAILFAFFKGQNGEIEYDDMPVV